MAITLNGITLSPGMVWEERHHSQGVVQILDQTISGGSVVFSRAHIGVKSITLRSLEDQGWLEYTVVLALAALADVPGAIYTLVIGSEQFSTMFRHHDAPALEFDPIIPRGVPLAGDYFRGTIRLMSI